jgi:hypothetical protein
VITSPFHLILFSSKRERERFGGLQRRVKNQLILKSYNVL